MIVTDAQLTSSNVAESDYAEYNPATAYALNDFVKLTSIPFTVTISISSPTIIYWTNHSLPAGTGVVFTTSGALPTGITAGTTYYVLANDGNSFKISDSVGGTPISTSGTQSGTQTCTAKWHKKYQSLAASNTGNSPQNSPTKWLDLGYTNRWNMFDQSVGTLTGNPTSIDVTVKGVGRIDSVALLNLVANSVTIKVTDTVDGIVYNKTTQLKDNSSVVDWYTYFFSPIKASTDLIALDLPPYANASINIVLTVSSGSTAYCGTCVLGVQKYIGRTEYGLKLGLQDYSIKTRDAFGNYSVTQRAFNKINSIVAWIDANNVDSTFNTLAAYRATPVVYVGDDEQDDPNLAPYRSSYVYGFFKQFSIEVQYATESVINIDVEGLT